MSSKSQAKMEELMRCERQQHLGAALYEHGADRNDQANGFYQRKLVTRLGEMKLAVPQSRSGCRLSTTIACNLFLPENSSRQMPINWKCIARS